MSEGKGDKGDKGNKGGWRLWAWGRKGRRRYTLRDVQSEEDVCLYHRGDQQNQLPVLKKVSTSDDQLLASDAASRRLHALDHALDHDDDDAESEPDRSDRSESFWESLTWRGDSQDTEEEPDTDKQILETELDMSEVDNEEAKKDVGGGAVQTIVERLKACGVGQGRAGDLETQTHLWTSHDLRQFLINKAHIELGGPYDSACVNNTFELKSNLKNNCNVITSGQVAPAAPPPSAASPPASAIPSPTGATPRPAPRGLRGRGRAATEALMRHWRCPRGSVQLEHMVRRDMSPPPPRPRLWSLPTIIITTSEDPTKSPSPPGHHSGSLSDSMNYLTVPRPHTFRPRPDDTQSEPCADLTRHSLPGTDPETGAKTPNGTLGDDTKLGSILDLWAGQWEVPPEDSESTDGRLHPPGSPPPDFRPQAATEYLQYEESFVSVNIEVLTDLCPCPYIAPEVR